MENDLIFINVDEEGKKTTNTPKVNINKEDIEACERVLKALKEDKSLLHSQEMKNIYRLGREYILYTSSY